MKFKMLLNIVRIKKFYRINLKLKIKLSEAIILFIVLYNSRESERKRNREREREGCNHGISNRAKAMVTERETTQRHPKYLEIV